MFLGIFVAIFAFIRYDEQKLDRKVGRERGSKGPQVRTESGLLQQGLGPFVHGVHQVSHWDVTMMRMFLLHFFFLYVTFYVYFIIFYFKFLN